METAGIELTGAMLEGCVLADLELAGGVLAGLELAGAVLADLELAGGVLAGLELTGGVLAGVEVTWLGSDKSEETMLTDDIAELAFSEKIGDFGELGASDEVSLRITGKLVIETFSFSAHPVIKTTPASSTAASRILSFFI